MEGHSNTIRSICFLNDGKMVASGSRDKIIKIWNIETGKVIRNLEEHTNFVYSICLSSNGKILVSGSSDEYIIVWNVETWKVIRKIKDDGYLLSVCF